MPRNIDNITNEIEEEGNIKEALSFNVILKILESEDRDILETISDLPSLPALLRQVHKHAYWAGAEYGRLTFIKISEDEDIEAILKKEYHEDKE
jgi:hypothetical protein